MHKNQVGKDHYRFEKYVDKGRWASYWHQIDEVMQCRPHSVLEIGPGPGIFKAAAGLFGIKVETVDIAADVNPDHLASAVELPFADAAYDCVCAFQVLEHLRYEQAMSALREMLRVSKRHVIISLPDGQTMWRYAIHVPMIGMVEWMWPKPRLRRPTHVFNGEHYWVINRPGFLLKRVFDDISQQGASVVRCFRVPEMPSHRFFVCDKIMRQSEGRDA